MKPQSPCSRASVDAATKLHDHELAELIRLSNRDRVVSLSYGPGWAAIDDTPENAWALAELAKIRERRGN